MIIETNPYKTECINRCSNAELAAMYLNDYITASEYFEEIKKRDSNDSQK